MAQTNIGDLPPDMLRQGASYVSTQAPSESAGSRRTSSFRRPFNLAGPTISTFPPELLAPNRDRSVSMPNRAKTSTPKPQLWGIGGTFPEGKQRLTKRQATSHGSVRGAPGGSGAKDTRPRPSPAATTRSNAGSKSKVSRRGSKEEQERQGSGDTNQSARRASEWRGTIRPHLLTEPSDPFDATLATPLPQEAQEFNPSHQQRLQPPIIEEPHRIAPPRQSFSSATSVGTRASRSSSIRSSTSDSSDSTLASLGTGRSTTNTQGGAQVGGELMENRDQWEQAELEVDLDLPVRNLWSTIRFTLREPLAEFLGMLVLIVLGVGADCQVKISETAAGSYSDMNWTWGFGVMSAIYIAGGISGGHMNPAITVSLAIFRGFPWRLVPKYLIAQVFGAFIGAFIIYGNYQKGINQYDPMKLIHSTAAGNASASLFITVPNDSVGSTTQGFCQEILATAVLAIIVLALGDENNAPPGAGLGALVLGFVVTAIGMSMGWISGYAINPARDFGPRLALWILGYGKELWTHNSWWWLVGPICGPLVGSIVGSFAYDLCIFTGDGSPVNFSGRELRESVGLPKLHNMVQVVLTRHRNISPSASDVEEGHSHPSLAFRFPSRPPPNNTAISGVDGKMRDRSRPASENENAKKITEVPGRWRIGKEKRNRDKRRKRAARETAAREEAAREAELDEAEMQAESDREAREARETFGEPPIQQ